jgi:hypothetical protein
MKLLLTDRSWPHLFEIAKKLAEQLSLQGHSLIFVTDKIASSKTGNFEVINILEVPKGDDLIELQSRFPFSFYKFIVPERAFSDYSSFRKYMRYSNISDKEVEFWLTSYANAFIYIFETYNIDCVIENAPDCFIPPLIAKIANYYRVKYYSIHLSYWHKDGVFFFDKDNWTSSHLENYYHECRMNRINLDKVHLDSVFKEKKATWFSRDPQHKDRVLQYLNRRKSYNPLSYKHWFQRLIFRNVNRVLIKNGINWMNDIGSQKFVLYPIHISPEASLLGNTPELADQLSVIKNISMNLPWGVMLYVKEHPHVLEGHGLDYRFYKSISNLNNVRLLRKELSVNSLIQDDNFIAVVGLNGTVCIDAVIMKKPVILLGNPYFGFAECFVKLNKWEDLFHEITLIQRGEFIFSEDGLYSLLATLDANVCRGNVDFSSARTTYEIAENYNSVILSFINDRRFFN